MNSGHNEKSVSRYGGQTQQLTTENQLQFGNMSYNALAGSFQKNAVPGTNAMAGHAICPTQITVPTNVPYQSIGTVNHSGNMNMLTDWSRCRDARGPDGCAQGNHVDDYFSEEEIRSRSSEMLENEDMQHLLRMFTVGSGGVNMSDDSYSYSAFTPSSSYSFSDQRSRGSGKAVVGWLKLKAALRWGIFIRKIAAEKRAQLEELD